MSWVALMAALAASFALACGDPPRVRGVVLVVVDTLRADHLGAYGYERDTSPRMDAFASDAVLFENAISPAPWTLPSLATIMTSLYPTAHGALAESDTLTWMRSPDEFRPVSVVAENHTTLAETLRDAGYATAGFVRGSYPAAVFGFDQGFDHYTDNELPGLRFNVEALLGWLDREQPSHFFTYLHIAEVHSPYTIAMLPRNFAAKRPDAPVDEYRKAIRQEQRLYRSLDFDPRYAGDLKGSLDDLARLSSRREPPTPEELQRLVDLYDRGIAYTDHWIGRLLDGLSERGLYEESLVIVTSDHGDEFGEHGGLEHGKTYYEELLRVPLLIHPPGGASGLRVEAQVGLVDLLPTVLDVVGLAPEAPVQGLSLRSLWEGGELPARPAFGEAAHARGMGAVRTNRWKYVHAGPAGEELYDLHADPAESVNRCASERATCETFRRTLRGWHAEMRATADEFGVDDPPRAVLDEKAREHLRALGYGR